MKDPRTIIKHPVITEKGTFLREKANQYLFKVARDANKIEVKKAVETLFKVKVLSVHTISVKGKQKQVGRLVGRTPGWKKAVVTLKEGQSLEFYEGV